MTTMRQLRTVVLELPETEEGRHGGMVSFSVSGKGFVSVTKEGAVQLRMGSAAVDDVVAAHPGARSISRNTTVIGVAIPLAEVNGKDLRELVRTSWAARAPERLAAALAASERGEGGDLPAAIGRPATRALHAAGLRTLAQVSTQSEADLLALHGVGPKAIRILVAALAADDHALRE